MDQTPPPLAPAAPAAPAVPADPAARSQAEDFAQLDTLATLYYVLAAFTGVFALFPLLHLFIGIAAIVAGHSSPQAREAAQVGWMFVILAVGLIGFGAALATLFFQAARRMRQRRSHVFCMVAAGVSCLWVPFGTVLGVLALVNLNKPHVQALFDRSGPAPAGAGPAA